MIGAASALADPQESLYVNNLTGSDQFDGLQPAPKAGGQTGPFQTIQRALDSADRTKRIEVAATGQPYRGGNVLRKSSGTAESPLVIDGHGAVISGMAVIPAAEWQPVEPQIYKREFWPMSNQLRNDKQYLTWIGVPQIWRIANQEAPNCATVEELRKTPGGFFWNKAEKSVWVHLPEGKEIDAVQISLPVHGTGFNIQGPADHIVVQNFIAEYSWNDGFSAHGEVTDLVFRNCKAINNCGQGFSFHSSVHAVMEDCAMIRNASSGACDINTTNVTYRRCVIAHNSFEAGVYLRDDVQGLYEDCLILANKPFEQIRQRKSAVMNFANCVISGTPEATQPLVRQEGGTISLKNCTLQDASALVEISGTGTLTMENCKVARIANFPTASTPRITLINTSPETGGAHLPASVWKMYEESK